MAPMKTVPNGNSDCRLPWTVAGDIKSQVFATTTSPQPSTFAPEKFSYAWWSAWLYDLDGFGWGEPDFAAVHNLLPDRSCKRSDFVLAKGQPPSAVGADGTYFWVLTRLLSIPANTRCT